MNAKTLVGRPMTLYASKQGWGIINHDLFLSNAQIRQVIRRAIDGQRTLGWKQRPPASGAV